MTALDALLSVAGLLVCGGICGVAVYVMKGESFYSGRGCANLIAGYLIVTGAALGALFCLVHFIQWVLITPMPLVGRL